MPACILLPLSAAMSMLAVGLGRIDIQMPCTRRTALWSGALLKISSPVDRDPRHEAHLVLLNIR